MPSEVDPFLEPGPIRFLLATAPAKERDQKSTVPKDDDFFEMCSFVEGDGQQSAPDVAEARDALESAGLTDEQLLQLNEDDICAGLLDRAERLRKAYADEHRSRQL